MKLKKLVVSLYCFNIQTRKGKQTQQNHPVKTSLQMNLRQRKPKLSFLQLKLLMYPILSEVVRIPVFLATKKEFDLHLRFWRLIFWSAYCMFFMFSHLDFLMYKGLKNTRWCGRNQVIVRPQVTFYLDGAHTPKSMEVCYGQLKTRVEAFCLDIY